MTSGTTSLEPWGRATLVGAPLLILIARVVNVPWDDSHAAKYVQNVASSPIRSDIGATLVVLAAALSIPSVLYLATIARAQRPRLGFIGGVMAFAGYIGMVGVGTKSLDAGQIVRYSPRATAISVSEHLALDVHSIDLLILAGVVGYVLFAVCLYRNHPYPRAIAILIGLGGMTTMFTSQGPIRILIITTTLILLIGQSWLAATITRTGIPATTPASQN